MFKWNKVHRSTINTTQLSFKSRVTVLWLCHFNRFNILEKTYMSCNKCPKHLLVTGPSIKQIMKYIKSRVTSSDSREKERKMNTRWAGDWDPESTRRLLRLRNTNTLLLVWAPTSHVTHCTPSLFLICEAGTARAVKATLQGRHKSRCLRKDTKSEANTKQYL